MDNLIMGILADGQNLKYKLPNNDDLLGGSIVGMVIESARKLSDGSKDDIINWIELICEQAKDMIR